MIIRACIYQRTNSKFTKYKSEFLQEQRKHSKENYGPDCTVSNTKFSSVTLNELAMKARERILWFRVSIKQPIKDWYQSKWGPNDETMFRIHMSKQIKFSDFSEYFHWSQRTKKKNINYTMNDVRGCFLGLSHSTTPAAVTTNKI